MAMSAEATNEKRSTMAMSAEAPYNFHLVNIHERRGAAMLCRAIPLATLVVWLSLVFFGVVKNSFVLLCCSAIVNVAMWLWIVFNCFACFVGVFQCNQACASVDNAGPSVDNINVDADDDVVHLCVIPNFTEEEAMMADTLKSLTECHLSSKFRVVLAMEEREGEPGVQKGERLKAQFEEHFAAFSVTQHPGDLKETHLDNSVDAEVPGKASNLKWAVQKACEECEDVGIKMASVLVTVLDADCLFHPGYFKWVDIQHRELKAECKRTASEEYLWTGYQAPQTSFRNYYESPVCTRAWTYVSTVFELGGVSGLSLGGSHMFFSSYTLPLQLVMDAGLWSGDIVAEDHHIYLKSFFYSIRSKLVHGEEANPLMNLVAVPFPVKSTGVISDKGYWQTYVDRFHQGKRHTQGVSELSYAFMAFFSLLCTAPLCSTSLYTMWRLAKTLGRLLCIHILPVLQSCTLAIVTVYWLYHGGSIPGCPDRIWFSNFGQSETILCGMAGAWALVWPVAIPMAMVAFANSLVIWWWFVVPGRKPEGHRTVWDEEDAKIKPTCGSQFLTIFWLVAVDCLVLIAPVMFVYGMVPMFMAYANTLVNGNRIKYITASKASSLEQAASTVKTYGTLDPTVIKSEKEPEQEPMC